MKSAVAVIALAATGVSAHHHGNNTVVSEAPNVYTTFSPEATQATQSEKTYTVTELMTLTVVDPCTATPFASSSAAAANTGGTYINSTAATGAPSASVVPVSSILGTAGGPVPTGPVTVPTNGAGKTAALSGAGLLGLAGAAAFLL